MKLKSHVKVALNRLFRPLDNQLVHVRYASRVEELELIDYVTEHSSDLLGLVLAARQALGRDCTFVQIGANDGVYYDPYRAHILERGLQGVLVEPLPWVFERLKENYQGVPGLRFANVAIGAKSGDLEMFRMIQTGAHYRPDFDDMTSSSRAAAEDMIRRLNLQARIETLTVPCLTLEDLIRQEGIARPSFLWIDVEGGEWEIFRTIDFESWRPAYIQFEHVNLDRDTLQTCYKLLHEHGYGLTRVHLDTIAIHQDACK